MLIRLDERKRVYEANPSAGTSQAELALLIGDLLFIIAGMDEKPIGFTKEENK